MLTPEEVAEEVAVVDIRALKPAVGRDAHNCLARQNLLAAKGLWGVLLVCAGLVTIGISGPAAAAALSQVEREACLSATGQSAVTRCYDALQKDPRDSGIRLALSDALVQLQRYHQAITVLRGGLELEPDNDDIKNRLSRAEQMHKEHIWIEQQKQKRERSSAAGMTSQERMEASRFEIRCSKLTGDLALQACNEGLNKFPGRPMLYIGKGDALMAMERYGEAIEAYQDALTLDSRDATTKGALKKARALRKVSAKKCLELSGTTALEACNAAVKKGGLDEVAIRQRQGDLLNAAGKTQAAVSAYQAALAVDGSNPAVIAKLRAMGIETADSAHLAGAPSTMTAAAEPQTIKPSEPAAPVPTSKPAPPPVSKPAPPPAIPASAKMTPKDLTKPNAEAKPAAGDTGPPQSEIAARDVHPSMPPETKPARFSNAPLPSGFTH